MKAMLLAAGRGARLKPLTDTLPKPLIQIGSHCLIEYHLLALKKAGIFDVVINVWYCAEQIIAHLGDGQRYGMRISYSKEQECLGTGGGIFQALPLLGEDPFILISADIWSLFPFEHLKNVRLLQDQVNQFQVNQSQVNQAKLNQSKDAHLILVENPSFHPQGDYSLSDTSEVAFSNHKLTYAGIAKIHPQLFQNCQSGNFSLSSVLNKAILDKRVTGELYKGEWFNVGTPEELNVLLSKELKRV